MDEHTRATPDPYAPPAAPVGEPHGAVSGLPLFKISGIGIATFFGSILAGGLLVALNFRRMGQPERFWSTIGLSVLGLVVTLAIGMVLPEEFPGVLITVPTLIAVMALAGMAQGDVIRGRERAGLAMRSNWLALGIALLVLLPLLGLGIGLVFLAGG